MAADHARRRPPQQAPEHRIGLEPHEPAPPGAAGLVRPLRPPARGHPRRRRRRPRGTARIPPRQRPGRAAVTVRVLQEAQVDLPQPGPGPQGRPAPLRDRPALRQDEVDHAAKAAATPAARLVLVLAAMHAARRKAIRELLLDDVDLGNRRLTIGGRTRLIDELTRQVLVEWLSYRNTRWPCTANPHLLINQMSANGTGPVSTIYFAKTALRGQAATLERLRVDRQLQEALARGPDPLHLAAMFGLDPKTAIRYAENARLLLTTGAEEQDPASSREPKGQNEP